MAADLGKDCVLLNSPVQSVTEEGDTVIVTAKTGDSFKCKKLIIAVPPNQLSKFQYSQTSVARMSLEPWKFACDMGSSIH